MLVVVCREGVTGPGNVVLCWGEDLRIYVPGSEVMKFGNEQVLMQ